MIVPGSMQNLKAFMKLEPSESKVPMFSYVTGCVSGRRECVSDITVYTLQELKEYSRIKVKKEPIRTRSV